MKRLRLLFAQLSADGPFIFGNVLDSNVLDSSSLNWRRARAGTKGDALVARVSDWPTFRRTIFGDAPDDSQPATDLAPDGSPNILASWFSKQPVVLQRYLHLPQNYRLPLILVTPDRLRSLESVRSPLQSGCMISDCNLANVSAGYSTYAITRISTHFRIDTLLLPYSVIW
ncbi:hypothetical protein FB451DRAFT_1247601 [Mycena latifolia]|nr:hypothetical protein FB451DRAFT_1247601 [Mycena latifolia]